MRRTVAAAGLALALALCGLAPGSAHAETDPYDGTGMNACSSAPSAREEFETFLFIAYGDFALAYEWSDEEFEYLTTEEALSNVWVPDYLTGCYVPMLPDTGTNSAFLWTD